MKSTLWIVAATVLVSAFNSAASAQDIAPAIQPKPASSAARPSDAAATASVDPEQKDADSKMNKKVRDAIEQDSELSASLKTLTISTEAGVVTIRGQVPSELQEEHLVTKVAEVVGQSNVRVQ